MISLLWVVGRNLYLYQQSLTSVCLLSSTLDKYLQWVDNQGGNMQHSVRFSSIFIQFFFYLDRVTRLHLFQWKRLQNKQIFDKNETHGSLNVLHFNRCWWLVLRHSYFCKVMHFVHFLSGKFALVFWLWNWMDYHFFRIIVIVYVFGSSQLNCTMCAVAVWRWSHYSKVRFEIILLCT